MGLRCEICTEPVIGRGVLLIEEPPDEQGEAAWGAEIHGQWFTDAEGKERRFAALHPLHFEQVMEKLYMQEGSTAFTLVVANVEDMLAVMEMREDDSS